MVVRAFLFRTRGGRLLGEFEPKAATWQWAGNPAETVDVTIDMNAEDGSRDFGNMASPWAASVAIVAGGRCVGGPILPHDFSNDGGELKISARGIRHALAQRKVLPVTALSEPLVDADGKPKPSMDTVLSGYDYGSMGALLVQQALTWPSWTDVPMTFQSLRAAGSPRAQSWPALDMMDVDTALTNLSNLEGGADIRIELQQLDADHFGWAYRSGSEASPRLQSPTVFTWDISDMSDFNVQVDPSRMGSVAWSLGGRSEDRALVDMLYDPTIVDAGGLLLERVSDASQTTSTQENLRAWNIETLRTAGKPWQFWSFKVPATKSPFPFEYAPGDLVRVNILRSQPVAGGYISPGLYTRRIAALSGDEDEQFITITCGENYG